MRTFCTMSQYKSRNHVNAVNKCVVILCRHERASGDVYMAAQKFELSTNVLAVPAPGQCPLQI